MKTNSSSAHLAASDKHIYMLASLWRGLMSAIVLQFGCCTYKQYKNSKDDPYFRETPAVQLVIWRNLMCRFIPKYSSLEGEGFHPGKNVVWKGMTLKPRSMELSSNMSTFYLYQRSQSTFQTLLSLTGPHSLTRWVTISCRNWGMDTLSNITKATETVSGRVGSRPPWPPNSQSCFNHRMSLSLQTHHWHLQKNPLNFCMRRKRFCGATTHMWNFCCRSRRSRKITWGLIHSSVSDVTKQCLQTDFIPV